MRVSSFDSDNKIRTSSEMATYNNIRPTAIIVKKESPSTRTKTGHAAHQYERKPVEVKNVPLS